MVDTKEKWYFKNPVLIGLFLTVGPLMLPLIWLKPGMSRKAKIIWTILIAGVTYFSTVLLWQSVKTIISYYQLAFPTS